MEITADIVETLESFMDELDEDHRDHESPVEKEHLLYALESVLAMDTIFGMVKQLAPDADFSGLSSLDKHEICLTAVSQIGNELAAAMMFLAGASAEVPTALRTMGNNYLSGHSDVAQGTLVKETHDRLADKIEMTRKFREATSKP